MIIHAGVRFHYGHYFGQDCGARRGRAGGDKMGTVAEQRQYERNFINLKKKVHDRATCGPVVPQRAICRTRLHAAPRG